MKEIIVRQYGLLPPMDWDEDAHEHLFLQNKLWNRFVEIERFHRKAYQTLVNEDQDVLKSESKLKKLMQIQAQSRQKKKELRAKARSKKKADTKALDATIKECVAEIKKLKIILKEQRKSSRGKNKKILAPLDNNRKEDVKKACQESGLWWGNYNAVYASYNVARSRAMKEGVDLKFHRFDGSGRFTCQIQGGMTVEELFEGQKIVGVKPLPKDAYTHPYKGERRRLQRTELSFTIYTKDNARRTLSFPMIMHRPFPEDVRIKHAVISKKRIGTNFKWSITITATKEGEKFQPDLSKKVACGINWGWKLLKNGSLRIATVVGSDNTEEHFILPADVVLKFKYIDELKSKLDTEINEMHAAIKKFEFGDIPDEVLAEKIKKIRRAPKIGAGKLAACVLLWKDNFADFQPVFLEKFESWRKVDKRKRNEISNLRGKLIRRRLDLYRNYAKKIANKYGLIGLHEFNLKKAALLETKAGEETPLPKKVRYNRTIASISVFRDWIKKQAFKAKAQVVEVKGPITVICHNCGTLIGKKDRTDFIWKCENCGIKWDVDTNAGKNVLATMFGKNANPKLVLKIG